MRQRQVPPQQLPALLLLVADQARPVASYVRAQLVFEVRRRVVAVHDVAERFAARAALSLVAAQVADGLGGGGLGRPSRGRSNFDKPRDTGWDFGAGAARLVPAERHFRLVGQEGVDEAVLQAQVNGEASHGGQCLLAEAAFATANVDAGGCN